MFPLYVIIVCGIGMFLGLITSSPWLLGGSVLCFFVGFLGYCMCLKIVDLWRTGSAPPATPIDTARAAYERQKQASLEETQAR